jgi:hypothetical protein
MGQDLEHPMAGWSDDQLLGQYRALTAGSPTGGAGQDTAEVSAITEEILRRGLPLPDDPTIAAETVDWSDEGNDEDPGSGALPNPF